MRKLTCNPPYQTGFLGLRVKRVLTSQSWLLQQIVFMVNGLLVFQFVVICDKKDFGFDGS